MTLEDVDDLGIIEIIYMEEEWIRAWTLIKSKYFIIQRGRDARIKFSKMSTSLAILFHPIYY